MLLREFSRCRPPRKFLDCFLGEVLPTANVDRLEPAFFAPAPGRAGRDAHIRQPLLQADYRPRWRIAFENCFHAGTVADHGAAQNRQAQGPPCRNYLARFGRPGFMNESPMRSQIFSRRFGSPSICRVRPLRSRNSRSSRTLLSCFTSLRVMNSI